MNLTTSTEVWEAANTVHCHSCDTNTPFVHEVSDEAAFEDAAYEDVACCDDPVLSALIVVDEPLGLDPELDDGSHVLGVKEEIYEYNVEDVLALVGRKK